MAYRLVAAYHDRLLYVHDVGWHYWDGQRWAHDDIGAASRAVITVLRTALTESLDDKQLRADVRRCESHAGIHGVLGVAAALTPFATTVRDLDPDPYLLNVANGTLDLRTMELAAHNPADRITKVTRAAYTTDTSPGDWHRFLTTVLPNEPVRTYLQRVTGLSLCGKVIEHILAILTGTGANGKGTFYNAVLHALGDYGEAAEPDLFMHREGAHPAGQMALRGKRIVIVSESDDHRRLAEATMKRLTGGDPITARYMRQNFVTFTPSHTALLVTNHLPKVSGDDPAVWRRLRVIPFDVEIPPHQQDGHLDEKLQADADAILTWTLNGWTDYQHHGLAEPPTVIAATDEYKTDNDTIARFIAEECTTTSPTLKATTTQLFEAWQHWRTKDGAEEMTRKAFGQALDRHGYPVTDKTRDGRWRAGIGRKIITTSENTNNNQPTPHHP
ncbi:phage/plasmid primase, P4 family [Mycolicibacterium sp. 050232]|uniref:DNA primase family protein n=1 Tax=Mycolicibacterium sp. 050232 TaxID=3113982 RepID=UPI002E2D2820|nr:phage/plasmid primase, P4 family [Mycolicibacterium sp. 050232]MED5812932.1 phage/plasmid primase, P4 family [Mycolicibacterium sp. 050232]